MGGADIIPGVSGGTIALILGIYQRLVTAISHVDRKLFQMLKSGQWSTAFEHLDLRFLVALGLGILTGIACLAKLVRYLLLEQRMYTLAVFFGLILASAIIVARTIRPNRRSEQWMSLALALLAAGIAYWIVGLEQLRYHDSLIYFYLCGSLAICAMILPGISGAYILWLLGAYAAVTEMIESVLHFQLSAREFLSLAIFAVGCLTGLIAFSKVLRQLLVNAYHQTMAVLGGFMVGSLRGVWPFQIDLTPQTNQLKLKRFQQYVPETWDQSVTVCVVLGVVAMMAILFFERWGRSLAAEAKS